MRTEQTRRNSKSGIKRLLVMPIDANWVRYFALFLLYMLLASGCSKKAPSEDQAVDFVSVSSQSDRWLPDIPGSVWIYGHPWPDAGYPITVYISTRSDSLTQFFDFLGQDNIATLKSLSDTVYGIEHTSANSKQVVIKLLFTISMGKDASVDRSVFYPFSRQGKGLESYMSIACVNAEPAGSASMPSFSSLETNVFTNLVNHVEGKSIEFQGWSFLFQPVDSPQQVELLDNIDDFVLSDTRFGNIGFLLPFQERANIYSRGVGLIYIFIYPTIGLTGGYKHMFKNGKPLPSYRSSRFPGKATFAELIYCRFPGEPTVEFINEGWLRKGDEGELLINYTNKRGPQR